MVELPRETGGISTVSRGNPNEAQLLNKIIHPTPFTSQRPGDEGELLKFYRSSSEEDRSLPSEFEEPVLRTWTDMVAEALRRAT